MEKHLKICKSSSWQGLLCSVGSSKHSHLTHDTSLMLSNEIGMCRRALDWYSIDVLGYWSVPPKQKYPMETPNSTGAPPGIFLACFSNERFSARHPLLFRQGLAEASKTSQLGIWASLGETSRRYSGIPSKVSKVLNDCWNQNETFINSDQNLLLDHEFQRARER